MIGLLKILDPRLSICVDSALENDSKVVSWHSTLVSSGGQALAGGFAVTKELARRIAAAELIERSVYRRLVLEKNDSFELVRYPTTCGFAAGFEDLPTMFRAIAEAVERWAWTRWIDEGCRLPVVEIKSEAMNPATRFFYGHFDRVLSYGRIFGVEVGAKLLQLKLGVFLGIKGNGIFPGSRVCALEESPWEHAALEAWRHLVMSQNLDSIEESEKLYYQRVKFFSANASKAMARVAAAENKVWPSPKLQLLKKVLGTPDGVFVWRALCEDFKGWHLGDERRFVY